MVALNMYTLLSIIICTYLINSDAATTTTTTEKNDENINGLIGLHDSNNGEAASQIVKRSVGSSYMGPSYSGVQDDDFLYYPKRAPSGFLGMRGKKYYFDNYYDNDKRAPSGFMGMRGKKEKSDILSELQYLEQLNGVYDNNHNIENLKIDPHIFFDLLDQYQQQFGHNDFGGDSSGGSAVAASSSSSIGGGGGFSDIAGDNVGSAKRAPSAGFFGMRGKRLYYGEGDKRAPSAGFFGMRGKKWTDEISDNNSPYDGNRFDIGSDSELDKRAPSMGFHGMRGKKDVSNMNDGNVIGETVNDKRAPSAGFFGMRGKKVPSGFFGMRGKKGPFEFRGKFVGVRGKQIPPGALKQLVMNLGEYQLPELQSAHLVDSELESNKRAPSGFLGMRGKKSTSDGSGDDNN